MSSQFDPSTDLDTYYVVDHLAPAEEWLPGTYTVREEWPPGTYTVRFDLTDGLGEQSATAEYEFTVVE
ncbi:MAG: hypothetical protein ACOCSN_04405 [Halanaeroarchaeum sp.]